MAHLIVAIIAVATRLVAGIPAHAAHDYPNRPIRLIIPQAPPSNGKCGLWPGLQD
jgi:tripartite-type tricarboxylate transporter receptor subunit TctC